MILSENCVDTLVKAARPIKLHIVQDEYGTTLHGSFIGKAQRYIISKQDCSNLTEDALTSTLVNNLFNIKATYYMLQVTIHKKRVRKP